MPEKYHNPLWPLDFAWSLVFREEFLVSIHFMAEQDKKVVVLLTTFNGAKYLSAQLESLLGQVDVEISVIVNDDGSSDDTMQILNFWREKGLISQINISERIGSSVGFLQLLRKTEGADLVAFCDQDDIWEPRKLISMIQMMKHDEPCMVFSGRSLIDKNGHDLAKERKKRQVLRPSFANALVENVASGNCTLLNNKAVKILNLYSHPPIVHYDSWIYLIMTGVGSSIYTHLDLVKYRIHDGNSVGLRRFGISIKLKAVYEFAQQANYLNNSGKVELKTDSQLILDRYLNLFRPANFIISTFRIILYPINRQSFLDAVFYKLLLIYLLVIQRRYI
jgi:glycosyltransferase involved in cell wall biosynthesis